MFVAASLVHELLFEALRALIESRAFAPHYTAWLAQSFVNALVGVIMFQIVEGAPGFMARRRARSAAFSKRRF